MIYYNTEQRHSSLGYLAPLEYIGKKRPKHKPENRPCLTQRGTIPSTC